ncbi:MAG: PD-(D/E)XK nuclease family protein [Prevotellaceae bacterium]|jgi:hypothetical protein|nr:PD-(D/E)XK nuclease family protein [Prevotellaceae bacterium]
MNKENRQSKFMNWGQKNEATLSHFVAWTLKCATVEGAEEYGRKLSNYSKEILFFLLFGEEKYRERLANYSVESVEVWREWNRIDVLAEITLSNKKKYVLCIELKTYSHTNERQLQSYKEACKWYENNNKEIDEKRFILLGAWDDNLPQFDQELCNKFGFSIYSFADIASEIFNSEIANSGEKLFDEFWTGYW